MGSISVPYFFRAPRGIAGRAIMTSEDGRDKLELL